MLLLLFSDSFPCFWRVLFLYYADSIIYFFPAAFAFVPHQTFVSEVFSLSLLFHLQSSFVSYSNSQAAGIAVHYWYNPEIHIENSSYYKGSYASKSPSLFGVKRIISPKTLAKNGYFSWFLQAHFATINSTKI